MASAITPMHTRADDTPINDMEFILFLASSTLENGKLTTPVDLADLKLEEIPSLDSDTSTDRQDSKEANDE